MTNHQIFIFIIILLHGCASNEVVDFIQPGDANLSCYDLRSQIEKLEEIYVENEENSGLSSQNIAMALIYWPGIFYNISQGSINKDSLNQRIMHLESLHKLKCQ